MYVSFPQITNGQIWSHFDSSAWSWINIQSPAIVPRIKTAACVKWVRRSSNFPSPLPATREQSALFMRTLLLLDWHYLSKLGILVSFYLSTEMFPIWNIKAARQHNITGGGEMALHQQAHLNKHATFMRGWGRTSGSLSQHRRNKSVAMFADSLYMWKFVRQRGFCRNT